MLSKIKLENILFIDIETVPLHQNFAELTTLEQQLWEDKTQRQRQNTSAEDFYEKAGIWAEFGKIICASVGCFLFKNNQRTFKVTSYLGDEKHILQQLATLVNNHFYSTQHLLCAHNGKEFDFPYIARRMLIHGMKLPSKLQLFGKKPWEVPFLDTMELWRFGELKNYTSLKLLAHILGIPLAKDCIDANQIQKIYYQEKDWKRIAVYCEKNIITVAQVLLRLRNEKLLTDDQIWIV